MSNFGGGGGGNNLVFGNSGNNISVGGGGGSSGNYVGSGGGGNVVTHTYNTFKPQLCPELVDIATYILSVKKLTHRGRFKNVRVFTQPDNISYQVYYNLTLTGYNQIYPEMNAMIYDWEIYPTEPNNYCKIGEIQ